MTWAEFKKKMEESGVKDDTEIDYIDVSAPDDKCWRFDWGQSKNIPPEPTSVAVWN